MKSILKLIYSMIICSSVISLAILVLCHQMPMEMTKVIAALNTAFNAHLWEHLNQWITAALLVFTITVPLLILILTRFVLVSAEYKERSRVTEQGYRDLIEMLATTAGEASVTNELAKSPLKLRDALQSSVTTLLNTLTANTRAIGVAEGEWKKDKEIVTTALDRVKTLLEDQKNRAGQILSEMTQQGELIKTAEATKSELDDMLTQQAVMKVLKDTDTLVVAVNEAEHRLTELGKLKQKIEEITKKLTAQKAQADAYAHPETGVDALLKEANEIVTAIEDTLNGIEEEDFTNLEQEVDQVADETNDLNDRIEELEVLAKRLIQARTDLNDEIERLKDILNRIKVEEEKEEEPAAS